MYFCNIKMKRWFLSHWYPIKWYYCQWCHCHYHDKQINWFYCMETPNFTLHVYTFVHLLHVEKPFHPMNGTHFTFFKFTHNSIIHSLSSTARQLSSLRSITFDCSPNAMVLHAKSNTVVPYTIFSVITSMAIRFTNVREIFFVDFFFRWWWLSRLSFVDNNVQMF